MAKVKEITIKEKIELLGKTAWDYKDIMLYLNVSAPTAIKYKKDAISNHNGKVKFMANYVRCDAVMASLGTTRSYELTILEKMLSVNGGK